MESFIFNIVDDSWNKRIYILLNNEYQSYYKRFSDYEEAKIFCDKYYRYVIKYGGALFLGEQSATQSITAAELAKLAEIGVAPDSGEWYQEIIFIPQIELYYQICFIDIFNYARGNRKFQPEEIQKEAKELLRWANSVEPISIISINFGSIGVRFLKSIPTNKFDSIFEKVMTFNKTYFQIQLSCECWRKTFKSINGFSLGPG